MEKPRAPLEGKTVLVTGAGGFLGGHVVAAAGAAGAHVRAATRPAGRHGRLDELRASLPTMTVFEADFSDARAARDAVRGVDIVIHLAGRVGVAQSQADPEGFVAANVATTKHLLDAVRVTAGIERLVLASTALVRGPGGAPPPEGNVYAATKLRAEALCRGAHLDRCPPTVIARSFNAFGPGQTEDSVMRTIIVQSLRVDAAGGGVIRLGALDHARDFIFAQDVAQGFVAAAAAPAAAGETVDLGTGRATSVRDVVAAAGRALSRTLEVSQDPARLRPAGTDPSVLVADATHAARVLGWRAGTDLDVGLRATIEWFRARPALWR